MRVERVTFTSDVGLVGHLYRDDEPEGGARQAAARPSVVLCTGFGGTQDTPSIVAVAEAFARAGYLPLTFDYRSFGLSGGQPRQVVDIDGQLADVRAAVAFVRGLQEVDPERVVLWGSSLGGGHVVTAAARDPRIAAVIAQVPFNGFPRRVEGRSGQATLRLLTAMVRDWLRGVTGRSPFYVAAVGDTDELAVMASPQAAQTIAALDAPTWQNRVAPRGVLEMMRYRPGDHAARLTMPLLVCVAERDRETQGETTSQLAERAPLGELRSYSFAHFDIYREENRGLVVADQLAFLARVLAAPRPGQAR